MAHFEDFTIAVSDPVRVLLQRNQETHFPSNTLISHERELNLAQVDHSKCKVCLYSHKTQTVREKVKNPMNHLNVSIQDLLS